MGTTLRGSSQTGHWGYWYDLLEPALVIGNDTVIDVEMPTFAAGQACKCSTKTVCLVLGCQKTEKRFIGHPSASIHASAAMTTGALPVIAMDRTECGTNTAVIFKVHAT